MKKIVYTFMLALLPMVVSAYDAKIDGIYYNLIPKAQKAEVTTGDEKYAGKIVIPATLEYEGVNYTVSLAKMLFINVTT